VKERAGPYYTLYPEAVLPRTINPVNGTALVGTLLKLMALAIAVCGFISIYVDVI